jgi:hypothetical protein
MSKRIVEKFGVHTLEVIEKKPERLSKVEGIGTRITRAKKLVIMIGTKKALAIAIRNNKPQRRYTLLSERLTAS